MSYDLRDVRFWKKVYEVDLENIVIELKEELTGPSVIILSGPVGTGKTTFTKKFIEEKNTTSSPSYSIINEVGEYAHADFYRLENRDEIMHLELPLYLEGKQYLLVEWGIDYVLDIYREVDDSFKFYELEISINEKKEFQAISTRNFTLKKITF